MKWLQRTLPDGYTVFHGVDWHSLYAGRDTHGEIDLIVMNRAGDLLLIEVKSEAASIRDGSLYKVYGARERDVALQLRVQYAAMRQLLQQAGLQVQRLCNCLVLPDWRAAAPQSLLTTARLNGLDAAAWLKDTLEKLSAWPNSRLDELFPLKH